ncbi:MAG: hypothetical protein GX242_04780 [Clostridiales bacterium]|nr:hypothetical protein [Clostridiales bacterium]
MKKVILIVMIIFINLIAMFFPQQEAFALDFPYIVVQGEVWLLDKESGNRIFLLPETYYAKIENLDDNYYYVSFNGVNGKVDKTKVSSVGYHATPTGTIQDIQIAEKYRIFTGIKLKSTMDSGGEDIEVPTSESLIFLGKYPSGEMWYYVKYNETCGYIRAEFTNQPNLVIPSFVPEQKPQADVEPGPDNSDSKVKVTPNLVKILVISGLCVGLAIIIILIFRPYKNKNNRYYYEE